MLRQPCFFFLFSFLFLSSIPLLLHTRHKCASFLPHSCGLVLHLSKKLSKLNKCASFTPQGKLSSLLQRPSQKHPELLNYASCTTKILQNFWLILVCNKMSQCLLECPGNYVEENSLAREGVLFWERRADIELRGVGVSCRVVLLWKLVQAT